MTSHLIYTFWRALTDNDIEFGMLMALFAKKPPASTNVHGKHGELTCRRQSTMLRRRNEVTFVNNHPIPEDITLSPASNTNCFQPFWLQTAYGSVLT